MHKAYTDRQYVWAVNLSALLGWSVTIGLPFVIAAIRTGDWSGIRHLLPLFAIFGLPIALIAAWVVVAPFMRHLMARKISYLRASIWGAGIGSVLTLISIGFGRVLGLMKSLNPNYSSQIGGGNSISQIDGVLTPYGWWLLAQRSGWFIAACIIVALIIRSLVGPGSHDLRGFD